MFQHIVLLSILVCAYVDADCFDNKSCGSCTGTKSWFPGSGCRWCPVTATCHEMGSMKNKCKFSQNVVKKGDCGGKPQYDVDLAVEYSRVAALAYGRSADHCLDTVMQDRKNVYQNVFFKLEQAPNENNNIAVAGVEHNNQLIISYRGSENGQQIVAQGLSILTDPKKEMPLSERRDARVQSYFYDYFESLRDDTQNYIVERLRQNPNLQLVFVGHSLGGAVASIASLWFSGANVKNLPDIINKNVALNAPRLYTYGMPRPGSYKYAAIHDEFVRDSFRVTRGQDMVPHLPPCDGAPGICTSFANGPYHHGREIYYDDDFTNPKTCEGFPRNEDLGCSNKWHGLTLSVADHKCYMGRRLGLWCKLPDAESKC